MPDIFCSTIIDKFYPFVTTTDKNITYIAAITHIERIHTLFGLHVRQNSPFHVGNKEVDSSSL